MSSTLHLDGLLASVGEQEIKGMFAQFGNVLSVSIYKLDTASSLGIGSVEMATLAEATKALQTLNRSYVGGKLLLVFHAHVDTNS
jgi:RNA recognition motif-containing protein